MIICPVGLILAVVLIHLCIQAAVWVVDTYLAVARDLITKMWGRIWTYLFAAPGFEGLSWLLTCGIWFRCVGCLFCLTWISILILISWNQASYYCCLLPFSLLLDLCLSFSTSLMCCDNVFWVLEASVVPGFEELCLSWPLTCVSYDLVVSCLSSF